MYRLLCTGVEDPYDDLCALFDRLTNNGADMTQYNDLLQKTVDSLSRTYDKRAISNLLSGPRWVSYLLKPNIFVKRQILNSLRGW